MSNNICPIDTSNNTCPITNTAPTNTVSTITNTAPPNTVSNFNIKNENYNIAKFKKMIQNIEKLVNFFEIKNIIFNDINNRGITIKTMIL